MDSRAASFNPHKHLKEEFVSNLTGSSMLEIAALSTVVPVIVLLRHSLGSRSPSSTDLFFALFELFNVSVACDAVPLLRPAIVLVSSIRELTSCGMVLGSSVRLGSGVCFGLES